MLTGAGWQIIDPQPAQPIELLTRHAVREFPTDNGPADYALFVDGQLLGIVEAKKLTLGPQGVLVQAERYSKGVADSPFNFRGFHVPFLYSTNGEVIWFHDIRDDLSSSRQIADFHTPGALRKMLTRDFSNACQSLAELPNDRPKLRDYQKLANTETEKTIAQHKRQMLIAMATGTGKTFTLVNQCYRLLKSQTAKRILFLVDRRALAAKECHGIKPDVGHARFEGAYVLQREPQSPAIPVVYVIEVDSDTVARRMHQFVWNQNQTPFLIVESPSTIRLYPGFAFNRDHDQPLRKMARGAADMLEQLAAFRAESIDDGSLWKQWAHAVDPSQRVDETLLRDLKTLDQRLQEQAGMDRTASHGLIGKYVYLNYLRHRGILSDKKLSKWEIDPEQLFSKNATLKTFHKVNDELQDWLNGSVFSLGEDAVSSISADQLKLVARVFAGDSPVGKNDIQTTLFSVYDFSHIPIETLSCVYEQFLHDANEEDGSSRGKTLGAYYTPLPLADYVLSEMDHRRPLQSGMTVLDPACGSGAFLVQCYRRLIERQRRVEERELKATELRDLLTKHIFGIDRDDDACRVAELSLIMTLLDYIEPPDLEHTNFKLPSLRNQNIVQGDFFDEAGPVHDLLTERRFDWIVGNPPWAEVKKTPAPDHEHYTAHQWMLAHKKSHPTSGNQLAEAFLWKAGEHLAKDGACGLVVLAMTWFKKEATTFRQRFFSERRVWCLANFANLAYVLFAGRSERPASVVFFECEKPSNDHVILTFAPFVANRPEKSNQRLVTWNIVVSGAELREIDHASATRGDSLSWKLAMWGTSRDRRLLERLDARFKDEQFSSLERLGIGEPHQGLELRTLEAGQTEEIEHHPELIGKTRLRYSLLRGVGRIFAFPRTIKEQIDVEQMLELLSKVVDEMS